LSRNKKPAFFSGEIPEARAGFLKICIARMFCAAFILSQTFALFFVSCSRSGPEVSFWNMRIIYCEEDGGIEKYLSFFALVNDADGPQDIAEIRLYNDFEGLLWVLKPENWVFFESGENIWIGSRSIAMPSGGEAFPSGGWRVAVADKSGEQTERSFGFDVPKESKRPFPSFSIKNGEWKVEDAYPSGALICYDTFGSYLQTLNISDSSGSVAALGVPPETVSLSYWGEDVESAASALTRQVYVQSN
jgi:hypothetical protein